MKTLLLGLALLVQTGTVQDTKELRIADLEVVLTHPANWEVTAEKANTYVRFAIPETQEKADLEIYGAAFQSEKDIWQISQQHINKQLNRNIDRQWEEEFSGVPLLLTEVTYDDSGTQKRTVTGLVYSRTPKKMVFRLTSTAGNFDKAMYEWRQVMQTAKYDAGPPVAEDGSRRPVRNDISHEFVMSKQPKELPPVVKGEAFLDDSVGGKEVQLRFATGWTGKKNEDGSYTFTHPQLSSPVTVRLNSILDSPTPGRALMQSAAENLKRLDKVDSREEKAPLTNKAHAQIGYIFRKGPAAGGVLHTLDAVGFLSESYWLLTWNSSNEAAYKQDKNLLMGLMDSMSIEPKS